MFTFRVCFYVILGTLLGKHLYIHYVSVSGNSVNYELSPKEETTLNCIIKRLCIYTSLFSFSLSVTVILALAVLLVLDLRLLLVEHQAPDLLLPLALVRSASGSTVSSLILLTSLQRL